ncbi:MAG: hypothetical protein JWM90_1339, partial [Thermoleophilia bacterium]|nr:hypothetical protein [Thermoleophilia bacterium]
YNTKLQSQQQVSSLQLQYERALSNEKIEKVRLEERLKAPYAGLATGMVGAYGLPGVGGMGGMGGLQGMPGLHGMNTLPISTGVPMGLGGGFGTGSGQTNVTNQTSTGGNQSVVNTNTNTISAVQQPAYGQTPWGMGGGFGSFGSGGFLSSLLGALI